MHALRGNLRRGRVWRLYLLSGGAACVLFALVPPFRGSGVLMNVLGLSAVLAVLAGLRLHQPASSAPWGFFAAALTLFWLGDLYTIGYDRLFHAEVQAPSVGDGVYVAVYPVLMIGLWLLVRRRNPLRDRAGAIDALIITIGLSLLSWVGLIAPNLHNQQDTIERLVSIAYPIGDIILLAAA